VTGILFARRVFAVAGVYGLFVLAPHYFMEAKVGRDSDVEVTHPEYFYGFVGVALAWQFAFLIISRDPVRYRLIMLPGIFEKVSFGLAAIVLYAQGRLQGMMLLGGCVDLVFAVLFVIAFVRTGGGLTKEDMEDTE
jgi:hypothetical protein